MTTVTTPVAERTFSAMGTTAQVLLVDGTDEIAELAVRRIADLEAKWSRFRADSEITLINENPGTYMEVSADTLQLLSRACEAWVLTGGVFDPTVLSSLKALGYDRSFEFMNGQATVSHKPQPAPGCGDVAIDYAQSAVCLPVDVEFDAGGIGKGLAADIVAEEALLRGAGGVLVNLGGDLVARGRSPLGAGWTVAVREPTLSEDSLATLAFDEGALATSSRTRRKWQTQTGEVDHLLDPVTGLPMESDVALASVLAKSGWLAEVAAKVVMGRGWIPAGITGVSALTVDNQMRMTLHGRMPEYIS
jgi:thiamine biosynthesis lipoprotein